MVQWEEVLRAFLKACESQVPSICEETNLPDIPPYMDALRVPRRSLEEFRRRYSTMLTFISLVLRKPEWNFLDMQAFLFGADGVKELLDETLSPIIDEMEEIAEKEYK